MKVSTANVLLLQILPILQTKYRELLNSLDSVKDNAGLMAIKFFMDYGAKEIILAGFDGYSHDSKEKYADNHMAFVTRNAVLDAFNEGMTTVLSEYAKKIKISFLTNPKYVRLL